ncbi:MAG: UDP-N-acetylmuramoyl-L-alanine--D-glutamate ligase [bacterium]|nr:UDP-N-acetylmuramoyl-L-alanine--D-glutamate ligase [bacterium]
MANSLSGKNVLVLGLGLHGGAVGTIEWLAQQGAIISVSDTKTKQELAPSIIKLKSIPNITYYFGNQDDLVLDGIDIIIRNPGVPRNSLVLQRAKEKNIPIEMDSSLFFGHTNNKNIIGVTGSKGKTTASTAISAVMKSINKETITVGVDGVSPLGASLPLPEGELEGVGERPIVFELSSWRLEALQEKKVSPHVAVVTSIYKDHLNTYTSYEEYIETKKQIILDQTKSDIAILNKDDAIIRTWENDVRGELFWFSLEKLEENENGIWVEGGKIYVNPFSPIGEKVPRESGRMRADYNTTTALTPSLSQRWERGNTRAICSVSDIPHASPHELRNKLPAILLGIVNGAEPDGIIRALQNAPALKHRLQFVRTLDGVRYVNDSAATMPDATIAAIESFGDKPLILILGGNDKALEFEELAQVVASHKNIWHLIWLPGTATNMMKELITRVTKATHHKASTMNEAVQAAHNKARPGETVLLSPGALSFGLFLHEFDRGNAFIKAVEQLGYT